MCNGFRRNRNECARVFCSMTIALRSFFAILNVVVGIVAEAQAMFAAQAMYIQDECAQLLINRISNNNSAFVGCDSREANNASTQCDWLALHLAHANDEGEWHSLSALNIEWFKCVFSFHFNDFSFFKFFSFIRIVVCRQKRLIFNPFFSMQLHSIPFMPMHFTFEWVVAQA